jgi:hypothetical protein
MQFTLILLSLVSSPTKYLVTVGGAYNLQVSHKIKFFFVTDTSHLFRYIFDQTQVARIHFLLMSQKVSKLGKHRKAESEPESALPPPGKKKLNENQEKNEVKISEVCFDESILNFPMKLTHDEQKFVHEWAAAFINPSSLLPRTCLQDPSTFDDPLLAIDWDENEVRNRQANLLGNLRPPQNYKVVMSNAIVADLAQMGYGGEALHPPDPAGGPAAPRSRTLFSLPNDQAFFAVQGGQMQTMPWTSLNGSQVPIARLYRVLALRGGVNPAISYIYAHAPFGRP